MNAGAFEGAVVKFVVLKTPAIELDRLVADKAGGFNPVKLLIVFASMPVVPTWL